jgi:prevent-host-death family protein
MGGYAMQIGLREANMHFSKYIKLVKKGREIVLTERGVPIAAIRPVAPKEDTLEERLNALKDRGVLKRGSGHLKLPTPVALSGKAVSSIIIDERNERL